MLKWQAGNVDPVLGVPIWGRPVRGRERPSSGVSFYWQDRQA